MIDPKTHSYKLELAAFAAGCFWGVEEAFLHLPGAKSTQVGFMGGTKISPTYKEVCSGKTGHAETVQIEYNPKEASYENLLEVFWEVHDPTQINPVRSKTPEASADPLTANQTSNGVNQQRIDTGSQYRSVIFFYNPEQEVLAKKSKKELENSGKYNRPVATQIVPAAKFWPAEEYHQQYFHKTGTKACGVFLKKDDGDKIEKSKEEWKKELGPDKYRILRQKGTEPAFSGKYYNLKEGGTYLCAACQNPVFPSEAKYDSGTGWPSFWAPASDKSVKTGHDISLGTEGTEVICQKCGSHLGHVFNDGPPLARLAPKGGPKPTGKRFCINSLALNFEKDPKNKRPE